METDLNDNRLQDRAMEAKTMHSMWKLLGCSLALSLALGVSGCSEDESIDPSDAGQPPAEDVSESDDTEDISGSDADTGDPDPDADDAPDASDGPDPSDERWVSAYLPSWEHYVEPGGNWGVMESEDIDWDSFTHLIYFAYGVDEQGNFTNTDDYENMNSDRTDEIVSVAREAQTPVLASVGGWGNVEFGVAIQEQNRDNFVDNLVELIDEPGYDGIDLDMEPINDDHVDDYTAFVIQLHEELQEVTNHYGDPPILTTATNWQPEMHADLAEYFDQINLMTYDFSNAWEGWQAWHNSPLFDGGETFDSTGEPFPSIERDIDEFLDGGVPAEKLGFGITFTTYVWTGVSEPLEGWADGDEPSVDENVSYREVMDEYYEPGARQWDEGASAPYLSLDDRDPPVFISYDDEESIEAKFDYVEERDLGGTIIWEMAAGYRPDADEGQQQPLLDAVGDHR